MPYYNFSSHETSVASIKARRARGISGAPFVGPFVQDKGMDLGDFKSCHVAEPV